MRKFAAAAITAFAASAGHATEPVVRNLAPQFAATYDATAQLPPTERVAAMKQVLVAQYPEFYGRGTPQQQDARIARAIENFPKLRTAYLDKAQKFGGALQQHMATFNASFPQFRLTVPTALVHSLGEMDGGTRELGPNGELHLIFGADLMAALNPDGNAAPLFHHELFHVLHAQHFSCDERSIWSNLWREGLAVHVSEIMNPGANGMDLLLEYPKGMPAATRAQLPAAWAHLASVLDSTDNQLYGEMFMTSSKTGNTLPTRRGYYLGYLVAREAGKTRDLAALANLGCKETRALVEATIAKLSKEETP
jgi:hypothetical protein